LFLFFSCFLVVVAIFVACSDLVLYCGFLFVVVLEKKNPNL